MLNIRQIYADYYVIKHIVATFASVFHGISF